MIAIKRHVSKRRSTFFLRSQKRGATELRYQRSRTSEVTAQTKHPSQKFKSRSLVWWIDGLERIFQLSSINPTYSSFPV
ncbi:hypothetical protein HID58_061268 [Brassica napus]|uniref:Uncharacterized protein n=1 Tax=Brassica napus TaxID=3708 RepID=A0ABQ7ZYN0_BRANA|nr:hypothetical protein HID58_061268 [Brassica napus]